MTKQPAYHRLLLYLRCNDSAGMNELIRALNLSSETVRQALYLLNAEGLVETTHLNRRGQRMTATITRAGRTCDLNQVDRNIVLPARKPYKRRILDNYQSIGGTIAERIEAIGRRNDAAQVDHSVDSLWHEHRIRNGATLRARRMG